MKLQECIRGYIKNGKFFFTQEEALAKTGLEPELFWVQAHRLVKRGSIKRLRSSFFMIIPDEYLNFGSLPTHWIIDSLMKYLGQSYYVGLLSAGAIYGATAQVPMTFQVITNSQTREILLERKRIEFYVSKNIALAQISRITVPTGTVAISTKEQTMIDLVRFYKVAGYLSNVASVVKRLAEEAKMPELARVLKVEKNLSAIQRLGYILETTQFPRLAEVVENELAKRSIRYVLLRPDYFVKTGEKAKRWKVILNDTLEVEE